MKIFSSSLLFCFSIVISTFALKCHSQGYGYTDDLRIGRKEMRYGRALEEGQGQVQGLEVGHGQELGLGHEHEQGHGQESGPMAWLGFKQGQGQGQESGHGIGSGSEHEQGQAQGLELGHGQPQGHELGQVARSGSGKGLGQLQGPEHGHDQTQGSGHGLGQTPGQGLGQSHGSEHGQTHGQEQPQGMGSGLGQGHGLEHGHGQGQVQGQGHGQEHGHGQGHGQGQGQGHGSGHGHGSNHGNNKRRKVKGMFVFGSSLVDNGNNMFLPTIARPSSLPYGIDFPAGPTGRFTNGKNVIDCFCDHLKLPQLPPFHDPSPNHTKIINGVDFASGGSGIIDFTGAISGRVSWLREQISNFELKLLPKLEDELKERREEFLSNYIFVIGVGGNDYTLTYFPNPIKLQSLESFTRTIVNSLSQQIKKLYSIGARKFVLMAAYPMGCYPKNRKETSCNDKYNEGATLYNFHLKSLIDHMTPQLPGSHFAFVDTYNIVMDLINNPHSRGFNNGKDACCELRQLIPFIKKGGLCKKNGHVCKDRNAYVFFDGIHPTQAVNKIIGEKAFHSNLASEVYPINLSKLSAM